MGDVPRERLTAAQARRVALVAQGFGRPGAAVPGARAIGDVLRRLGVVQIDSVNVLARAHYLPFLARLGGYDRTLVDDALGRSPRRAFEYWGHEAALLPVASHPLVRWRMARAHSDAWGGMVRVAREQPGLVDEVAAAVRDLGPVTATALEAVFSHIRRDTRDDWGWNWSAVKRALEYLFWAGEITSAGRDGAFRRRYDLPERVLPAAVLSAATPDVAAAHRELVLIAARAQGVATVADLADHFRMALGEARSAVSGLVEEGRLTPVTVAGWPPAVAVPGLRVPRRVPGCALLAPFDPLIWYRPRTERLFGMRYRVEIYVPAAQRTHGYYVLPFLHGDQLVARVDLKADRQGRVLRVRAAHREPGMAAGAVPDLAGRLWAMAGWLALDDVVVEPVGDLAGELARAVAAEPA